MKFIDLLKEKFWQLFPTGSKTASFQVQEGQQIDGCLKIISKIAEAGMGSVWKAYDSGLGKTVVLKFPLHQTPVNAALLSQECSSCKTLKHKNIVMVYGLKEVRNKIIFLQEEYIVGRDFEDWRCDQPNECFPWHAIKQHMLDIADALAYAHSIGICHRDIKPRNIMLVENPGEPPFPKIIDFGISAPRHILGTLSSLSTHAHSPYYASPQQIGGLPAHPSDDIYSYCATLYHLLTGCAVFHGIPGNVQELIRYRTPLDPNERLKISSVPFRIPDEVVKAILFGLRKQRKNTPETRTDEQRPDDIMQIRRRLLLGPEHTVVVGKSRWDDKEERVRLATSGLMVIECLRMSLGLDDFLTKLKVPPDYRAHLWDRKIPERIDDGSLDGAVMNKWSLEQYLHAHPKCELEVICECNRSMGGKCFSLIGLERSFPKPLSFGELKRILTGNSIYVNDLPEHIDAVEQLLKKVFHPSERKDVAIEIVEPQVAFDLLERNARCLVYCGQNFRLVASQRGGYMEVISWDRCPIELQEALSELTRNCFVANRRFANYVGKDKLQTHCIRSQERFVRKCKSPQFRKEVASHISAQLHDHEPDENEVQEAINEILIRTF